MCLKSLHPPKFWSSSAPANTGAHLTSYIYIFVAICSDKPGVHDFSVLKKLVLPDGSILRARYAGRPTRDCLFNDPVMDGKRYKHIGT